MSQIEGVRPPSRTAPSIWYAEVAAPQRKAGGKVTSEATGDTVEEESGMEALPSRVGKTLGEGEEGPGRR
ncbi:hypothetical protein HEK131_08870 [Streptomyces seoulensis]|nr:hypothetical protein HEK131_08870 [Streptomyces seoulensis]